MDSSLEETQQKIPQWMPSVTWSEPPRIPVSAYKQILKDVRSTGTFAPRGTDAEIKRHANALSSSQLTEEQIKEVAAHLRGQAITFEAIRTHEFVAKAAASQKIQDVYDNRGIVAAARAARVPPLSLFKQLLALRGVAPKFINGIISGKNLASDYLSDRDADQLREACASDKSCRDHQLRTAERAADSENELVKFFTERGVLLKTQEELIAEGYTTATPDILFETPIVLNGHIVEWLDNKNYTFVPNGPLIRSTKKQAERNMREWGPGGFCYRGICGNTTAVSGAYLFDTLELFSLPHS